MSEYLEIPEFQDSILFRTFLNDGMTIVYPHWHKEIEIIYSRKGKVNIGVREEIVQLEEGEIFFSLAGRLIISWLRQRVNGMSISLI